MYLKTHVRVVAALLIREMSTRFGSRPGGYIWALVDPAAHIILLTVIFQAIARQPALGTSFPLFYATGYVGFSFYQSVVGYVSAALNSNKALLSYPNVAPFDTIVARYILQMGTTAFVAIIVIGAISTSLYHPLNLDWLPIMEAAIAGSLLALGTALSNTVLFRSWPLYESIYGIITRPLMLISGVFFLPDSIPQPFRDIVLLNPIAHVIVLFRSGFYPEYRATAYSPEYLYTFVTGSLLLGMTLFASSSKLLRNE
ncbi:ABC transporter permease [Rhizobium halophytocola]|uniref:Transport permease protein n=1 Tax=Rhizobium halophytocola TaxID=735519 RepID=A0ABS4E2X9_9HYPH|nr:ABC transporter permease [Rhizobium halophytocola]MBP1852297.1 capsular polysaccharide transport system permease protein [Rhizobium halophytocola]